MSKRRKPKSHILRNLLLVAFAMTWAYGAGRARTRTHSLKNWNPMEIFRVFDARQFEKRLANEIYGLSSTVGHYRFSTNPLENINGASLRSMIYDGKKGLAEFNGTPGLQAEEYMVAIEKIYGEKVIIRKRYMSNHHAKDVLDRLFHNTSPEKFEQAIRNWDVKPGIEPEKPKIDPYKPNIIPKKLINKRRDYST